MLTGEENDLLTRVENDAPMGRLMRRHWVPICMSEEAADPDGTPARARVLGEDLVVFRDTSGRVGVLGERCPHRRVSLALGRNEEGGLRCLFHGWKMDVEGAIVDMPSERFAGAGGRRRHLAYPAREAGGFVWAYMGDQATMPEFTPPPWASARKVAIGKGIIHANWAQVNEGTLDTVHSQYLHSGFLRADKDVARASLSEGKHIQRRPSADKVARIQMQLTSYGFRAAAIRTPLKDAETHDYVRVTVYVAPFVVLPPPNTVYSLAQVTVPVDDEHTAYYLLSFGDGAGVDQESWRAFMGMRVGLDVDASYRPIRNAANDYRQDRQAMKLGDFSGIDGLSNQDFSMWESMGAIADRTLDGPGSSDLMISGFQRLMIAGARAETTGSASTLRAGEQYADLVAFEGIVPKTTDWRTLAVNEREKSLFVSHPVAAE